MSSPSIYIIDDDQDILDSLTFMLIGFGYQPKAFLSPRSFLEQLDPLEMGVAIVDIQMPHMTGLELQEQLMEQKSPLALILLTGQATIAMAVKAIQNGAFDFLEKATAAHRLNELIQNGLSHSKERFLFLKEQRSISEKLFTLTEREWQIMKEVLTGKTNKTIAFELGIAQRTIEIHRHNIMKKIEVNNVAELAFLFSRYQMEGIHPLK